MSAITGSADRRCSSAAADWVSSTLPIDCVHGVFGNRHVDGPDVAVGVGDLEFAQAVPLVGDAQSDDAAARVLAHLLVQRIYVVDRDVQVYARAAERRRVEAFDGVFAQDP